MGKTFRIPISANGPRAHIYITNCCPYWEMCGGGLIECMYRCRCGRTWYICLCYKLSAGGPGAIISLDSVLLQLQQLSRLYSRKEEKYLNTLKKKYFAFWENIYIIVVFIFCCCEVSVNYVGLDTFNRLLAPGQSLVRKTDFPWRTFIIQSPARGVKAGPHRPRSWQLQGKCQRNRHGWDD